jgi:hypothetical protein
MSSVTDPRNTYCYVCPPSFFELLKFKEDVVVCVTSQSELDTAKTQGLQTFSLATHHLAQADYVLSPASETGALKNGSVRVFRFYVPSLNEGLLSQIDLYPLIIRLQQFGVVLVDVAKPPSRPEAMRLFASCSPNNLVLSVPGASRYVSNVVFSKAN